LDHEGIYNLAYDHAYNGDDGPDGNQVRHLAGLAAVAAAGNPERQALGKLIWETSRYDEGTISATGANIVADAIRAKYTLTPTS